MKKLLFLLMIALAPVILSAQDWKVIRTFLPQQTLHCIRFADDSVGYTVSSLYNGSTFNIYRTTDGGNTWSAFSSGYSATRFKDIHCFSPDTVMMCGNYGLVITSTDMGNTWIADTVSPTGDHFFGISFVGHTGYVCGNSGAIHKTTDMGDTWTKVDPPFITAIEDICFLTEDFGVIGGLNFIYYTEDGGNTWQQPQTFPGATVNWWLREFSFVNENVGYVCGDIGQVYKTTDGGRNWQYMPDSPTTESLQAIIALDENELFACGYAGIVMHSEDGAESWEIMTAGSRKNFNSIAFTPNGSGYMCSYIGEALKYIDPSVSVKNHGPGEEIMLFPNPAKDIIHITTESGNDRTTCQQASLFNSTGRNLGTFPATGELDLSGLVPGLYILVFYAEEYEIIRLPFVKQ